MKNFYKRIVNRMNKRGTSVLVSLCICIQILSGSGVLFVHAENQISETVLETGKETKQIQEPEGLYAQSAVLMDGDSGRVLFVHAENQISETVLETGKETKQIQEPEGLYANTQTHQNRGSSLIHSIHNSFIEVFHKVLTHALSSNIYVNTCMFIPTFRYPILTELHLQPLP